VRDNANGGGGNDIVIGNIADNELHGGSGNDAVYGGAGNDLVFGESGDDTLWGDEGSDILDAGSGDDFVYAGDGNDILYGGSGLDALWGEAGNDIIVGQAGNDVLNGGEGNDELWDDFDDNPNTGSDAMHGGSGRDLIHSVNGNDELTGDSGDDKISIDSVDGHNHFNDDVKIHGGSGSDWLMFGGDGTVTNFNGLGAHTDGIESVVLDFSHVMSPDLSFRDVIRASDTDKIMIDGNSNDTLNLNTFGLNDSLAGGNWQIVGSVNEFDTNGLFTRFNTFNYIKDGAVVASVDVESAIHVAIHNPIDWHL
jgi:hypothetical protein